MGAGKTTIGKALANHLKRDFYDLDQEIIKRCGVSIPTIFDIEGEDGFRKRESATLEEMMSLENIILATGGGAILRPENRALLKQGFIIYLHANAKQLYHRIAFDKNRPLMATDNPLKKIKELMETRHGLYESLANMKINTGYGTVNHTVNHIHTLLKQQPL